MTKALSINTFSSVSINITEFLTHPNLANFLLPYKSGLI